MKDRSGDVCDAWPVRRQTYGYHHSSKASPPIDWYQIILLGDRGTCVLTTCPGLHSTAGRLRFEAATCLLQVQHPNHSKVTEPHFRPTPLARPSATDSCNVTFVSPWNRLKRAHEHIYTVYTAISQINLAQPVAALIILLHLLHYALSCGAVYCNRPCLWRTGGRAVWVCYYDNSKLRTFVLFIRSSPNWVCR